MVSSAAAAAALWTSCFAFVTLLPKTEFVLILLNVRVKLNVGGASMDTGSAPRPCPLIHTPLCFEPA